MKQMGTVFRFEFGNYLRNKTYRILTILVVAGVLIGMSWPRISKMIQGEGAGGDAAQQQIQAQSVAVACTPGEISARDMAGDLAAQLPLYAWTGVDMDEAALTEAVRAGEYDAGLWMDGALAYRYIVQNTSMYDTSEYMIGEAVGNAYRTRAMTGLGMAAEESAALAAARAQGETVAINKDGHAAYLYTYVLVMMLYMAVALYGQFVSTSVAAEKSNRAMELLITSARPTRLMFGKVLGSGAAGLLQMSLFLVAAYAGYHLNREIWQGNALMQAVFAMPGSIFAYALTFFVLGFFLYASLYGALGSLVSRTEEVSTATMPVTMLFIVAFIVVITSAAAGSVDNALMKAASFVPFTSPMAMFVRITMGAPAAWEIVLSIAILAVSTVVVAMIAAGIYRVGVLLYGKPPKMKELFLAVRAARAER